MPIRVTTASCNEIRDTGMSQIVSFINYKGGTGKTTIAVETAATLARRHGFKVLLVDLDPADQRVLLSSIRAGVGAMGGD